MRRAVAVIGAALVLMVGGAVAYAAIPAADGTITGCVNNSSGLVRIIDTDKTSCSTKTEKTVPWNQAGVPGTNGVSGYEVVESSGSEIVVGSPLFISKHVLCPDGKVAVGGGGIGQVGSGGNPTAIATIKYLEAITDGSGWTTGFGRGDGSRWAAGDEFAWRVTAVCVATP